MITGVRTFPDQNNSIRLWVHGRPTRQQTSGHHTQVNAIHIKTFPIILGIASASNHPKNTRMKMTLLLVSRLPGVDEITKMLVRETFTVAGSS